MRLCERDILKNSFHFDFLSVSFVFHPKWCRLKLANSNFILFCGTLFSKLETGKLASSPPATGHVVNFCMTVSFAFWSPCLASRSFPHPENGRDIVFSYYFFIIAVNLVVDDCTFLV